MARAPLARALAILVALSALCSCRWVTRKEVIGYQGPARQDPFLAAERFLQKTRSGARAVSRLRNLEQHQGPLFASSQSFINYGDTDTALEWVRDGGHLILLLGGAERWRNDWKKDIFTELVKAHRPEAEETKLLSEIGITRGTDGAVLSENGRKLSATIDRRRLTAELAGKFAAAGVAAQADVRFGDKGDPSLASFRLGRGRVTVLANARPFRNRWIGEHDHAELLAALVDLGRGGEAWFLNGMRTQFWKMLWEQGWMALVALAVLFAAWLWKNLPRLGPLRSPPNTAARDFTSHLALTGAFLWRQHASDALLQPLRDAVTACASRLGWRRTDPDFIPKLAARCVLPEARVSTALNAADIRERSAFLRVTQDLRKMADDLRAKTTVE